MKSWILALLFFTSLTWASEKPYLVCNDPDSAPGGPYVFVLSDFKDGLYHTYQGYFSPEKTKTQAATTDMRSEYSDYQGSIDKVGIYEDVNNSGYYFIITFPKLTKLTPEWEGLAHFVTGYQGSPNQFRKEVSTVACTLSADYPAAPVELGQCYSSHYLIRVYPKPGVETERQYMVFDISDIRNPHLVKSFLAHKSEQKIDGSVTFTDKDSKPQFTLSVQLANIATSGSGPLGHFTFDLDKGISVSEDAVYCGGFKNP